MKEDTDFAKRVEEIIKNTHPGSEEEMHMIMSSKSNRIQRSPTKKWHSNMQLTFFLQWNNNLLIIKDI